MKRAWTQESGLEDQFGNHQDWVAYKSQVSSPPLRYAHVSLLLVPLGGA